MKNNKEQIHIECSPEFKKLVKETAARRGKSIKETTIMLLSAWLELRDNESKGILKIKTEN